MSLCENCTKGYLLPGEPTGVIRSDFDGAYFVSGGSSTRAIVLLTDAFGLPLKNNKILADNLAERLSCDVWVPDIFAGEPLFAAEEIEGLVPDRAGVPFTTGMKLRIAAKLLPRAFVIYRSRPSVVDHRITLILNNLKEQKKYEQIGAVGYCFGGSCAIRAGSNPNLNSLVICHPSGCTDAQVQAIKVPSFWACAEDDMSFGPAVRKKAEEFFTIRKSKADDVKYLFKVYKGTAHGFAARPNLSIPEVKEGYEQSFEDTVKWFSETIPV